MPALTNVDVVRALLWLGMRGVSIPDRVIGFALEEDFSETPQSHPDAVACALLEAADKALVLMERARLPCQPFSASLTVAGTGIDRADPPGGGGTNGVGIGGVSSGCPVRARPIFRRHTHLSQFWVPHLFSNSPRLGP